MANVEETWIEWQGVPRKCPRGSLVTSIRELSKRTGVPRSTILRTLAYIKKRDTIRTETGTPSGTDGGTGGTFVTIINYSTYQDVPSEGGTPDGTKTGQKRDTDGTIIRIKNKELRIIPTEPVEATGLGINNQEQSGNTGDTGTNKKNGKGRKTYSPDFQKFWAAYPRKDGKSVAFKAFEKNVGPEELEQVLQAIEAYKSELRRKGTEPNFIKLPTTFLNGEKWRDCLEPDYGKSDDFSKDGSTKQGVF